MIINTLEDLKLVKNKINSAKLVAYDTETTGLNTRKDTIIGFAIGTKLEEQFYFPLYYWNKEKIELEKFPLFMEKVDILNLLKNKYIICHNASFDLRITKNNLNIDLIGALFADTVLLCHTVDETLNFGLKPLGIQFQKELGMDCAKIANEEEIELKANIKSNGGSTTKTNYQLFMADMPIISKYCKKDVELTLRLFEYFSKKLEEEGLHNFFYNDEVMPLYKEVTIPMEERGIKLDIPKLELYQKEIAVDIKKLETEIQQELQDMPACGSLEQEILDKKVPISNKGSFAQALIKYAKIELPRTKAGKFSITAKTLEPFKDNEIVKFLLNPDVYSLQFRSLLAKIQKEIYMEEEQTSYIININSKQHLSKLFYEVLGETPISETEKGSPQMNDDALEELSKKYKCAAMLSEYNKLIKIKSSYFDRFMERQEDGRYYPAYKQHGTVSGRFSGDFQQMSKPFEQSQLDNGQVSPLIFKYTNAIRSLFIAGEGKKIIIADQSALEVRVFSHVSKEEKLIDIFKNGEDFYSKIAIDVFNLHELSAKETDENFLKKKNPQARAKIKPLVLSVPYGAESFQAARLLGVDQEEAQKFIDMYLGAYPNLGQMMHDKQMLAKTKGFVQTEFGRIRHLPKAKEYYQKYGDRILDALKLYSSCKGDPAKYAMMKVIRREYKNELNNAINYNIQSSAASIMNRSGISIARKLVNATIIGQVHDEYLVECNEQDAESVVNIVKDCMENTVKITVPLKTNPSIADSYGDGHE